MFGASPESEKEVDDITISEGNNTIEITATDDAGNTGTDIIIVTKCNNNNGSLLKKTCKVLSSGDNNRYYKVRPVGNKAGGIIHQLQQPFGTAHNQHSANDVCC